MKMPAQIGRRVDQAHSAPATKPTASMSQLMNDVSATMGDAATKTASHGLWRWALYQRDQREREDDEEADDVDRPEQPAVVLNPRLRTDVGVRDRAHVG